MSQNFQFHFDGPHKGDRIQFLVGADGTEPNDIAQRHSRLGADRQRIAFSINTWYPDFLGGYWVNPFLVDGLVKALQKQGIFIIDSDYFDPVWQMPVQEGYSISKRTAYTVCSASEVIGELHVWSLNAAGGNDFYKDGLILDFAVQPPILKIITQTVIPNFGACGVSMKHYCAGDSI